MYYNDDTITNYSTTNNKIMSLHGKSISYSKFQQVFNENTVITKNPYIWATEKTKVIVDMSTLTVAVGHYKPVPFYYASFVSKADAKVYLSANRVDFMDTLVRETGSQLLADHIIKKLNAGQAFFNVGWGKLMLTLKREYRGVKFVTFEVNA